MALFSEEWLTLIEMLGKETSLGPEDTKNSYPPQKKKASLSDWSLHGGSLSTLRWHVLNLLQRVLHYS